MNFHARLLPSLTLALAAALATRAQPPPAAPATPAAPDAPAGQAISLAPVTVTADAPTPPTQYQLPQVIRTVTAAQVADTVNAVDVEDAVKYQPSLFIRKRNYGDTQPTVATRTWGVNSSARSLVYADGVLLSALIANNNTLGAPRWGMVAPQEIDRIDVLYGPFAAAYPGNSMGAVIEITTRMPDRLEASLSQTEALQTFSLYSTRDDYLTSQTQAIVGNRAGKWSFWLSGGFADTHSQPLSLVTAGSLPPGTTGGIVAQNKLGAPADVLGASGLLDSTFTHARIRAAYDFTPALRATYTLGLWTNDTDSSVQTYLRDSLGQPTYAGAPGFASGTYELEERHIMQSLALQSDGQGDWDWQAVGSLYDFDHDTQKSPSSASATGATVSTAGKVADLSGTGWSTLDLKAAWHPDGRDGSQELSFGAHADEYRLVNPTYTTPDWRSGDTYTGLATEGNGKTRTLALWAQEAWQFAPRFKLTLGARYEDWRAFDGLNVNGATTVHQNDVSSADFSPKATLAWKAAPGWTVTGSVGEACRYPTAGELYQIVSTGSTLALPNGNLTPEKVRSGEVRVARRWDQGEIRLSLFQENVTDAIVSQTVYLPAATTYNQNVGEIRNRGVELFARHDNVLIKGLELSGSVTYVDSEILEDDLFPAAVGKHAPYVPDWRATVVVTYRPTRDLALTVAGRYSGRQYSTLDNTDVNSGVMGSFDDFFVLDAHVNWRVNPRCTVSGGVDNLLDRKYFLYHPFPQRTFVAELKLSL